ncbi:MBL fold metallo-hydrolase [Candidatus Bathyarchaeota archaeon]|nr:MBL fold metallo-hydrolase [Candidatus Bathyarchaeota archaeon]
MKIEIFGGKDEIGGNKILLEHKNTRIFLDFGMSFKQASQYFSEFLQPRKCAGLADFFELGLLPDIEGLYRGDYLRQMGREEEKRRIDALFLSHAHADHANYIHFMRFDIPIYCTRISKTILQCLEETGSNSLSDFITACEAFQFYENKKGGLSRVTRRNKEFVHKRDFRIMKPETKITIKDLEIEMMPVDHSLPGACGFIVYSDEGNLVYTGDIRFHGSKSYNSKKFVEKAKSVKPKWLLCEGTRIDSTKKDSEESVKERIRELISNSKGLVFIEHPARDLDRINSIFQSVKANNRVFVVNLKLAYLLAALGDDSPFSLDDIKILIARKSWGLICRPGFDCKLVEKDYSIWERDFINRRNSITFEDLSKDPRRYVVSMNIWEMNQLTDIRPNNAIWIKSSCDPFCDEMEIDEERKNNWLAHFNIEKYSTHASGHASGEEIMKMIKEIRPEILIPIHTENAKLFRN